MSQYYVGFMSFDSGAAIAHGRTPGAINGVSHTPGYKAVGKLAKGNRSGYGRKDLKNQQSADVANRVGSQYSPYQKKKNDSKNKVSGNAANRTSSSYRSPSFFSRAGEFVTGSQARKRVRSAEAKMDRAALRRYIAADNLKWANRYRNVYNTEESNADVSRRIDDFKSYNSQYAKAKARYEVERKEYEKTLPGMIEKAIRNISKMASDSYKKVSSWISLAIGKVKESGAVKKIKSAYEKVKGSGVVNKIKSSYEKARDAIRGAANSTMRKVRGIVDSIGSTANRIKEAIKEAFNPKWVHKHHESKLFKIKTNLP